MGSPIKSPITSAFTMSDLDREVKYSLFYFKLIHVREEKSRTFTLHKMCVGNTVTQLLPPCQDLRLSHNIPTGHIFKPVFLSYGRGAYVSMENLGLNSFWACWHL